MNAGSSIGAHARFAIANEIRKNQAQRALSRCPSSPYPTFPHSISHWSHTEPFRKPCSFNLCIQPPGNRCPGVSPADRKRRRVVWAERQLPTMAGHGMVLSQLHCCVEPHVGPGRGMCLCRGYVHLELGARPRPYSPTPVIFLLYSFQLKMSEPV
jgi:hypothetical protein